MERRQAETEAAYAREEEAERRARFDEHPLWVPSEQKDELRSE